MNNNISDNNLSKVSAGCLRRESIVKVDLELSDTSEDLNIKVYVDGECEIQLSCIVNGAVGHRNFVFNGSGEKRVDFKINGRENVVFISS